MTKVLIVEDDNMAQKLLEIYVEKNPDYHLVAAIDCAAMAEFYCAANDVDVILMDVCTAMGASGLDAAEKIKKHAPHIKIIIITSQPECSFIDRAHAAGVDSFWYKSATAEELMEVLRRTLEGESIYPDSTPPAEAGQRLQLGADGSGAGGPAGADRRRAGCGDRGAAAYVGAHRQGSHPKYAGQNRFP